MKQKNETERTDRRRVRRKIGRAVLVLVTTILAVVIWLLGFYALNFV